MQKLSATEIVWARDDLREAVRLIERAQKSLNDPDLEVALDTVKQALSPLRGGPERRACLLGMPALPNTESVIWSAA